MQLCWCAAVIAVSCATTPAPLSQANAICRTTIDNQHGIHTDGPIRLYERGALWREELERAHRLYRCEIISQT